MLKPMGKKASLLPAPHSCLEEWSQRQGSASLHSTAASRIQQRYRLYREKVRTYMHHKQQQRARELDEVKASAESNRAPSASASTSASSVKHAVRERSVAGSSMALAMAMHARKEESCVVSCGAPVIPHVSCSYSDSERGKPHSSVVVEPSSIAKDAPEWSAESRSSSAEAEAEAEASQHGGRIQGMKHERETETESVADFQMNDLNTTATRHSFVNVMEPSWLLATVEERCADAAASLGAVDRQGLSSLRAMDIRHTVLDLLFIFCSGNRRNVHGRPPSSSHVHHENLVARMTQANANANGSSLSTEDIGRIDTIFNRLRSEMVLPAVRCLGWILTKTWRVLFDGLHVDVASLERVRRTVEALEGMNVSLVFAPTHKTHLDYLILSYVCFAYGIPLPRIAAGNNLNLPLLGSFLRANGSFFIRRSFREDLLYKRVLHEYVHELLDDGNPIEVFVEGGRSRHGRVCPPRHGFLSMFADYLQCHADDAVPRDVLLLPISMDYDRVYEVHDYATQVLGKPKEKESWYGLLQSIYDLLFWRAGHAYVRFGTPLSMQQEGSIDRVARTLACRLEQCGTVTSTAITAAVLLWKRPFPGVPLSLSMLTARGKWLQQCLEDRHSGAVEHLRDMNVVEHAIAILQLPVNAQGHVEAPMECPTKALELGFYRNQLLHYFLPDMALALTLQTFLIDVCAPTVVLSLSDVLERAVWAWAFLLHVCRHVQIDLRQTLADMLQRSRYGQMMGNDLVVNLSRWHSCKYTSFVRSLAWPFADSLYVSIVAVRTATEKTTAHVPESHVVRTAQDVAKHMIVSRALEHPEALCSESIRQSLAFLVDYDMVEVVKTRHMAWKQETKTKKEEGPVVQALVEFSERMRKPVQRCLWRPTLLKAPLVSPADLDAIQHDAAKNGGRSVYEAWMDGSMASRPD